MSDLHLYFVSDVLVGVTAAVAAVQCCLVLGHYRDLKYFATTIA